MVKLHLPGGNGGSTPPPDRRKNPASAGFFYARLFQFAWSELYSILEYDIDHVKPDNRNIRKLVF